MNGFGGIKIEENRIKQRQIRINEEKGRLKITVKRKIESPEF